MSLRVLHCPTNVGGNPAALARAEREIGLASVSVAFETTEHGHPVDEVLFEGAGRGLRELRRWRLLVRALREFDVVHFNFGSTIAPRRFPPDMRTDRHLGHGLFDLYARVFELGDLRMLRRARKAVFVTYQGDDARLGGSDRGNPEFDRMKLRWVAAFDQYAQGIYALNPDLFSVLPTRATFLPYATVDPRDWTPRQGARQEGPLRIVHAPSQRELKGTRFVIEAVDRLKREGLGVDLTLVEQCPYADVREIYESADVAVDQLIAGWYGGFAVEVMALGKPVVCFIRDADVARIPVEMRRDLPLIQASPESIYDVLGSLLRNRRAELPRIGQESRAFVERWHDPVQIARRLKKDYEAATGSPHGRT